MITVTPQTHTLRALFVAWQDQQSRQYYPVARLVSGINGGSPKYEFAYVKGAIKAMKACFQPFLGLPDLDKVYRSNTLFPFFINRLMSPGRPDYAEFVHQLNLPANADEIDVLARSGGRRATDNLELFVMPQFDLEKHCYETFFLSHGIRYLPEYSHQRMESLAVGEPLYMMLDFQNSADHQAIALRTEDRIPVGYLPRYLLPDARYLSENCESVEVYVEQVNPAPAPLQQRLLCRLESCWPPEFKPFCDDQYVPIPTSATVISCGRTAT